MYIVGQERRLVDPPSQVVAGVRTVTTNMDGRDALPRMSRPFALYQPGVNCKQNLNRTYMVESTCLCVREFVVSRNDSTSNAPAPDLT
jgi:hypothetical protein